MIGNIKILLHQGMQSIPDITNVEIPGPFRGTPVITSEKIDEQAVIDLCPTDAIYSGPAGQIRFKSGVGDVFNEGSYVCGR